MGFYLNPANETKEAFLRREGIKLWPPEMPDDPKWALVCLIQNPHFSAAGVCYDAHEMGAFVNDGTSRKREFYWVPKEKLYPAMLHDDAKALKAAWNEPVYEARTP
jgi:hypothetical protein